eukprot:4906731-Lingulodinium_polyedra.AAC.1
MERCHGSVYMASPGPARRNLGGGGAPVGFRRHGRGRVWSGLAGGGYPNGCADDACHQGPSG